MKLVTKIFLQVCVGFLILSQVLFFYLLYETKKQNLMDVYEYEKKTLYELAMDFDREIQEYDLGEEDIRLKNIAVRKAFQEIFGVRAVLCWNGEELYNETAYEFDYDQISMQKTDNISFGYLSEDEGNLDLLIGKEEDSIFLIIPFEMRKYVGDTGAGQEQYQIIWCKDVTDIYARSRRLAWKGLLFTAIILVIMGSVFLYFLKRTMQPLETLRTAAAGIADGNYRNRVPTAQKDEIGALSDSFNRMAEQIEAHVEMLTDTNEAQRQLLAALAHELKTPMTAIIGYADTLLTVQLKEVQRQKALRYIGSECQRLSGLSAKMMELTGLYETGETSVEMESVSVKALLERLADLISYRLKEKNITLRMECRPKDLHRMLDKDLMLSLLMNLVDNAYKASDVGKEIFIMADEEKLAVQDQGTGIPKKEIARVTEAFYMVNKSRAKSQGSIGLGLALCQRIADIHHAKLEIESEVGEGTKVIFYWTQLQNSYRMTEK